MTSLDDAPLNVRAKHADYGLYLLGACLESELRQKIWVLSLLYNELNSLINSTSEEMIGHIRLAWWREHIVALHQDSEAMSPAHPVLIELAPIIQDISSEAWHRFFDYYSVILNTESDTSDTLLTSPIIGLLEDLAPKETFDKNITILWSIGELAISKVTPHLHYRYDVALAQNDNSEDKIITFIQETLGNKEMKLHEISILARLSIDISNDRITRLSRAKYVMHHPRMLQPAVTLPIKLWWHSRKP